MDADGVSKHGADADASHVFTGVVNKMEENGLYSWGVIIHQYTGRFGNWLSVNGSFKSWACV